MPTFLSITESFLGDDRTSPNVRMSLSELHGLWGGRAITVFGTGKTIVRIAPIPQHERRYELLLSDREVRDLLATFIENDFLTIVFPPRPFIYPDEGEATITLTNSAGEERSVCRWNNDPMNRQFEAVYTALRAVERRTEGLEPVYEGPFDYEYTPGNPE